jgi:hypothetical protein
MTTTGTKVEKGCKNVALRMVYADNHFILMVADQFKKTHREARIVFEMFKKSKAIKLDAVNGRWNLVHGAYWNPAVISRALEMVSK